MVQNKKRVERVPDEWIEFVRGRVEVAGKFKEAVAEIFAANAQLLALWRKEHAIEGMTNLFGWFHVTLASLSSARHCLNTREMRSNGGFWYEQFRDVLFLAHPIGRFHNNYARSRHAAGNGLCLRWLGLSLRR